MSQLRLSWAAASAALAIALLGCGGSDETYYIPADNQIRPFTPEASGADEGSDDAASQGDDDWGSSSDEGEADSAAPSAAEKPAESKKDEASAKGAVKPVKAGKSEKPAAAAKGGGAGSP